MDQLHNNPLYSTLSRNSTQKNSRLTSIHPKQRKLHSFPLERTSYIPASQKIPENDSTSSLLYKNIPPRLSISQKRSKFNSTETMFIENILHVPDLGQMIRCLAKAITLKIKQNLSVKEKVILPIFEEKYYASGTTRRLSKRKSDDAEVVEFLSMIFFNRKLPAECAVVAAVYIDKLLEVTQLTFHAGNWRIIVFMALLLANKVWSEYAVWNEDFLKVFSDIWLSIQAICRVEREFLKYLSFDLNIKPSVYSKYYFELRSYLYYTGDIPFKPLNKILALKLAVKQKKNE